MNPYAAPNSSNPYEDSANAEPAEPQVGDLIGNYMVVDVLAQGGMGRVYRVVSRDGTQYAMKTVLRNEFVFKKRLEREAQIGMILNHPNLVAMKDCDMNSNWPFLVQELLMGVNLRDLYRARRRLPERAVLFIVFQVAQALNAALRFDIIHRDIKPDNIFMCHDGTIKLLDLGLAKVGGQERLTGPTDLVGTLQFMAPEQIQSASDVDHRADIYGLGVTAYLLLTGSLPHKGKTVREIQMSLMSSPSASPAAVVPTVSPLADHMVSKMTATNPAHRYPTPSHLIADVQMYFSNFNLDISKLTGAFLLRELIPARDNEDEFQPITHFPRTPSRNT